MSKIDEFLNLLKSNIKSFAEDNWAEWKDAVITDAGSYLEKAKENLKRRAGLLAEGKLTNAREASWTW